MKPIRTYEITVRGFPPALYCARSPSQARYRCYIDFTSAYDVTFRDFLKTSTIRVVPNSPGTGDRILVSGKPATRVRAHGSGHYIHFIYDDSDRILCSHPLDVQPMPTEAA